MNAFPSKPLSDNRKSAIQNPKWLGLWVMALVLVAAVALAQGRQPEKIRRIGFLAVNSASADKHLDEAFKQSLRELGWVEGRNVAIEYRSAEGKPDRLPTLAAELVHAKVDVLVAGSPSAIRAARQATKTIPIVIVTNQDPVAVGYVESLARPGGNITGITNMTRELGGKRLELLRDVVPKLSRVGILWNARSAESGFGRGIQDYEAKAKALNIPLESLPIRPANLDFEGAFRSAAKARVSAVITLAHIVLSPYRREIAAG